MLIKWEGVWTVNNEHELSGEAGSWIKVGSTPKLMIYDVKHENRYENSYEDTHETYKLAIDEDTHEKCWWR